MLQVGAVDMMTKKRYPRNTNLVVNDGEMGKDLYLLPDMMKPHPDEEYKSLKQCYTNCCCYHSDYCCNGCTGLVWNLNIPQYLSCYCTSNED